MTRQTSDYKYRGKYVGKLLNGCLFKKGKQVVLFRNFDGFGFSVGCLKDFDRVQLEHDHKVYKATVETIKEHGIEYKNGFDTQLVLPRKHWQVIDPMQRVLL